MKSPTVASLSQMALAVIPLFTVVCVGCGTLRVSTGDGDGEGPPAAAEPTGLDSLRVEFRNLSATAVDTQFYTTDDPAALLPDDLLVPDNLRRSGIGVAGTGILGPFSVDEVELGCSEDLVVGTAGGEFLDADLGTPLGQGPVRFMQAGFQFDCGASLVLEYSQTTGGYTVTLFQDK